MEHVKEIKELDKKYLVLKWEDINALEWELGIAPFNDVIEAIKENRKADGKKDNRYLVLNLDDDISIQYLHDIIHEYFYKLGKTEEFYTVKIKYLAHHLVNAILKAKEKQ